jgi:kinetochore protein Fta7
MPPKRKRSDEDADVESNKPYAYLKPSVRRVPEKTIKAKWSTLPEPVQDKVRDLFHSLERPVIVRQQNERKRIEAQSAVQAVVRKYVFVCVCVLVASHPRLFCSRSFAAANIV